MKLGSNYGAGDFFILVIMRPSLYSVPEKRETWKCSLPQVNTLVLPWRRQHCTAVFARGSFLLASLGVFLFGDWFDIFFRCLRFRSVAVSDKHCCEFVAFQGRSSEDQISTKEEIHVLLRLNEANWAQWAMRTHVHENAHTWRAPGTNLVPGS